VNRSRSTLEGAIRHHRAELERLEAELATIPAIVHSSGGYTLKVEPSYTSTAVLLLGGCKDPMRHEHLGRFDKAELIAAIEAA
jgi:hypothetical protein